MEKQTQNSKRGRFLLALPVLVFPFLTLIFWSLGGGKGNEAGAEPLAKGLNAQLPGAKNKAEPIDKMGFYSLAEKDSLDRQKQKKSDPYYMTPVIPLDEVEENSLPDYTAGTYRSSGSAGSSGGNKTRDQEAKVYEKLNALQAAINQPEEAPPVKTRENPVVGSDRGLGGDVDRLEKMMQMMNSGNDQEDPEMEKINGMLERILDLQHPERVKEKIRKSSSENKGNVYPVSVSDYDDPVTLMDRKANPSPFMLSNASSGFYSLDDQDAGVLQENLAIQAVVHETQTIVNGSTVKLRLLQDVFISGVLIPKDNFVFGIANLNGERLQISLSSLRYGNSLFPIDLVVYDIDGLAGIAIPGAVTRDVAKQSGERALQGFGITTMDPSLGAQAASAGIELTRNLVSRKVKIIRVQVKAGYQVLLYDNKQKQVK